MSSAASEGHTAPNGSVGRSSRAAGAGIEPAGDSEDLVLYQLVDGIAVITFNRADRLNALTRPMRLRLLELLAKAGDSPDVRVVVLTGAGRAFCAGADRDYLTTIDAAAIRALPSQSDVPLDIALRINKPVIAAINGAVAGIGFVYALMADIRFAAEDAKFTTAFAKLGLVAEGGLSWLLPRAVGTARALDLLYSARAFNGIEAKEMGLVQWTAPADEVLDAAMAYARALAENSAYSLSQMRKQIYRDWNRDWDEAYASMQAMVTESVEQPDFIRAMNERRDRMTTE